MAAWPAELAMWDESNARKDGDLWTQSWNREVVPSWITGALLENILEQGRVSYIAVLGMPSYFHLNGMHCN